MASPEPTPSPRPKQSWQVSQLSPHARRPPTAAHRTSPADHRPPPTATAHPPPPHRRPPANPPAHRAHRPPTADRPSMTDRYPRNKPLPGSQGFVASDVIPVSNDWLSVRGWAAWRAVPSLRAVHCAGRDFRA